MTTSDKVQWMNQTPQQAVTLCNCRGPQNGEPLCPCQMANVIERDGRWVKREVDLGPAPRKTLPVIPLRPKPEPREPDGATAVCECGVRITPTMYFVCSNPRCPIFPVVTC